MSKRIDKTAKVLTEMLTENTGRSMLDSGDAYGRNWEKNQGRDLEKAKPVALSFETYGDSLGISITFNVYHWLKDKVTFDQAMDTKFHKWAAREENEREAWLTLMEGFVEYLREQGNTVTGLYGDGEPMTVNTYNGEDALSQVIQYVYFEIDGEEYALISIHGGCDVRGGYTKPRAFTLNSECGLFDNARGSLYCEKHHDHVWDTDNAGYDWDDNVSAKGRFNITRKTPVQVIGEDGDTRTVSDAFKPGTVVINKADKTGHCPHCGGKLKAWWS